MKTAGFFAALTLAASFIAFNSTAYAEPKPWIWSWGPSHWDGLDFIPYQDGKHPHNSQWDESNWQPEHWAVQRGDGLEALRGFYFADILRGQYEEDDIPVLEVGPAFYTLGGHDQRRVAEMVDYVYGITASKTFGMFQLYDWRTKKPIGAYTQYGLHLQ